MMASIFASTIWARRAAVVSSVSRVPRSFSPAIASAATMDPPDSIRNSRSGVSTSPTTAPPSRSALAGNGTGADARLAHARGLAQLRTELNQRMRRSRRRAGA